ncbi:MAG: DUF615 domain-containing protein, partial [Proteobacteria bacterium]|nr:DUF615 domain-containing protein [Pseudomonadota bacterium]
MIKDRFDRGESRRQVARREQRQAGDQSARLAHALMKLHASLLAKLELDEQTREAVERARKITAHIARRRAERALANDLRGVDLPALATKLANVEATGAAEPRLLQLAEHWRTRLIEEGIGAAAMFPGGAADPLPKLVESAQRERTTGKPPGAARALFRHLVVALKPPVVEPPAE